MASTPLYTSLNSRAFIQSIISYNVYTTITEIMQVEFRTVCDILLPSYTRKAMDSRPTAFLAVINKEKKENVFFGRAIL